MMHAYTQLPCRPNSGSGISGYFISFSECSLTVSRLQELRHDSVTQGQHEAGTIGGTVQRSVAVDSMYGAQQDDTATARWSHCQVCQRRQGTIGLHRGKARCFGC